MAPGNGAPDARGLAGAASADGTPRAAQAPSVALELRDVWKRFGRTEIIRGASLSVRAGERVAIIGPNGAGKSTLFNLVSGRLAPSAGEIRLQGARIDGLAPHLIHRRGLARSFQVSNLFARLSVFENLRCAVLWSLGVRYCFWRLLSGLHEANARATELMALLRLERRRDVLALNLTYAEQRALEIGLAIAGGAPVVLLDEPTAGMSRGETRRFVQLIREVTHDRTLLVVEHDMGVVFDLADRIAVLVHGEVIAFDAPAAVRADPRVREAYLGAALAGEGAR
jgi:branched-chain amino acid transport system ATP-binding protein